MKKSISILILSLSLFSYTEERTLIYLDRTTFKAPLPVGYCDATKNLIGEYMIEFINLQNKNMNYSMPRVKKVFTRCGYEDDFDGIYPWGWIGVIKIPYPFSQLEFNKMMKKMAKDTSFLNKIGKQGSEATEKALSELGAVDSIFQTLSPGETAVVWSDRNVLVMNSVNRGYVEGEFFEEKVTGGVTLLDDFAFYYYITDDLNGKTNTKETILKLIKNAELLSKYNR